jgi:hypothetical protein
MGPTRRSFTVQPSGEYRWSLTVSLDENGILSLAAFADYAQRTVELEAAPPEQPPPATNPAEMLETLIRQAELFVDKLRTNVSIRARFGPSGIWSSVKRRLMIARNTIEAGDADAWEYNALLAWIQENLMIILATGGIPTPEWLR